MCSRSSMPRIDWLDAPELLPSRSLAVAARVQ